MKPGYLYMIVGNTSGHYFKEGDLVASERKHISLSGYLCECQYGHSWWVNPEDVIEIGEI